MKRFNLTIAVYRILKPIFFIIKIRNVLTQRMGFRFDVTENIVGIFCGMQLPDLLDVLGAKPLLGQFCSPFFVKNSNHLPQAIVSCSNGSCLMLKSIDFRFAGYLTGFIIFVTGD